MNKYPHILSEQVNRLADSSPEQFHVTLISLAQDVLRTYNLDRLSLFASSPVLLSQGDFLSTSLDWCPEFSYSKHMVDDFKEYIQIVDQVDDYLYFNYFDLLQDEHKSLKILREEGVKSHVIIPISVSGQKWGALTLSSFSQLGLSWHNSPVVTELKAIGNLWLCFWQRSCALQANNQNGGTFLTNEKEKLLALPKKQRKVLELLGKDLRHKSVQRKCLSAVEL